MAGAIASLVIKLGLDASGVAQGAKQAQQSVLGITKGNVVKAVGVGLAGAFGMATKGALELEDAQARFQADTGASAAEADHMADKLNALSGSSLVGFDDLDKSMTMIRTDLGLTGDAADKAIDQFAAFERATGQGADAVSAFDDIEDAYGKTAADTAGIMDVLVASHQKFGGTIADQESNLSKLSGVVQAYGGDWEDANKILNLANATGIDGTEMVKGMSTAVKKFPPGTTFDEMFQSLVAIKDPAERAKAAIEDFGAKAGPKLAAAIENGTTSLDEFMVTTDDAKDATKEAQQVLDDTWGSKLKLLLNGAQAAMAGFGKEVGPILTGAASLGTLASQLGLGGPLKAAGAKAAGVFGGAFTKVLGKLGIENSAGAIASKFMGALGPALVAAAPFLLVAGAGVAIGGFIGKMIIGPAVDKATSEMQQKANAALAAAGGNDAELARQQAVLEKGLADFHAQLGADLLFGDNGQKLQDQLDAVKAARAQIATESKATATAIVSGQKVVEDALNEAVNGDGPTTGAQQKMIDLMIAGKGGQKGKDIAMMSTREMYDSVVAGIKAVAPEGQQAAIDALQLPPDQAAQLAQDVAKPIATAAKGVGHLGSKIAASMSAGASQISGAWDVVSNAFNKGPKIMSLDKRLDKGRAALKHAYAMMRKAVKAGDPLASSYWADQYNQIKHATSEIQHGAEKTGADVQATMASARKRFGKTNKGITADSEREGHKRTKSAKDSAQKTADAAPDALQAAKAETSTAAKAQATAASSPLKTVSGQAMTWGQHLGGTYASGIESQRARVAAAALGLAGTVHNILGFSAPPKAGPLSDIRQWGPHMVDHWAKGTEGSMGRAEKTAMAWAKAARPDMQVSGWQPAGLRARHHRGYGQGSGGGDVHIHVGTLIANDKGIDELQRRMGNRTRLKSRDRRDIQSPNGQDR